MCNTASFYILFDNFKTFMPCTLIIYMHHLLFFCMLTFTKIILYSFGRDRHSNTVEVQKFFCATTTWKMNLNGTKTDWKHILIPQEMPYWYQGHNHRIKIFLKNLEYTSRIMLNTKWKYIKLSISIRNHAIDRSDTFSQHFVFDKLSLKSKIPFIMY